MGGSIVCRGKFSCKNMWLRDYAAACSTVNSKLVLFFVGLFVLVSDIERYSMILA